MKRAFTKYPKNYVRASYNKPDSDTYSFSSGDAWICKLALEYWREHESDNMWVIGSKNTLDKLIEKLDAIDKAGGIV